MSHSDPHRPTARPAAQFGGHSMQPVPLPLESDSPSSDVAGEDFLYHLSRGSELLKENLVQEAKEALELALGLQPRDLRGQGLLGVVYFRLGLYPRAIDIYRQIVDAFPDEIKPKVNLALCYVKTGQHQAARELLEDVVQRDPDHHRAWAYLGLVFQFQRDYAKSSAAFERAEQRAMAERMRQLATRREPRAEEPIIATERWELRAAAQEAFGELETNTTPFHVDASRRGMAAPQFDKWQATEPGEAAVPRQERRELHPSTPLPEPPQEALIPLPPPPLTPTETVGNIASSSAPTRVMGNPIAEESPCECPTRMPMRDWLKQRHVPPNAQHAVETNSRTHLVNLNEPFAIRATAILAISPIEVAKRELRVASHSRFGDSEEPLGGALSPIVGFRGPGTLLARASNGCLESIELEAESLTVRLTALFGLGLGLQYESERIKLAYGEGVDFVHVGGHGPVVLLLSTPPMSMDLSSGGGVVRFDDVIGWTGEILLEMLDPAEAPGHARGFVSLRGNGSAIIAG